MRLTESAWSLSRSHSRSMNPRAALDELKRVIGSLRDVLRFSSKHEHPATLELMGLAINEAWTIADKIASRPADYIEAYEIAKAGVSAGLCGDLIFGMMIKSTGGLLKSYGIRDALTPIQIDSVIQRISQIKLLVKTVNPPLCSQHADALDLGLRKITNQIKPPTE